MRKRLLFTTLVVLSLVLVAGTALADELIVNGGFETGNLSGWTTTTPSNVTVANTFSISGVPNVTVNPYEGNYMAVLSSGGRFDADLSQVVDPGGVYSLTVSFAYDIWARDMPPESGADFFIAIANVPVFTLTIDDLANFIDYHQGWQTFSTTLISPPAGTVTIGFQLHNVQASGGDIDQAAKAFVDVVSVDRNMLPEPGTFILLGAGLLGVAAVARRKKEN